MTRPRDRLLTDTPVGHRVQVEAVSSPPAHHRLRMLGIEDADELLLEHRGDYGDLIVAVGGRHVHLSEQLARRVFVRSLPFPQKTIRPDAAFIAMHRFRIIPGVESGFEQLWRERESYLAQVPGFVSFRLLKGPKDGGYRLYASHTQWVSREDFDAWRGSEAFHKAHAQTQALQGSYDGLPMFEGFDVVLEETADVD